MGFIAGLLWSVAGAFTQSGIDVLRKHGSNVRKIAPNDLVALVTLFDASLASAGFVLTEGPGLFAAGGALSSTLEHPTRFVLILSLSSTLLLLSKALYQRALHVSPLSLTVPYLSFIPAIMVIVGYLVLGEVPTPWGMLGVAVVTAGGYLLSARCAPPAASEACSSPSKARATAAAAAASGAASAPLAPAARGGGPPGGSAPADAELRTGARQQLQGRASDGSGAVAWGGAAGEGSAGGSAAAALAGRSSPWALRFARGRRNAAAASAHGAATWADPERGAGTGAAGAAKAPAGKAGAAHAGGWALKRGAPAALPVAADAGAGAQLSLTGGPALGSALPAPGGASGGAAGGQAPPPLHLQMAFTGGEGGQAYGHGARALQRVQALLASPSPRAGPVLVLCVALCWSITASLDKLGVAAAGSVWPYFLGQRLLLGTLGLSYLLRHSPAALAHVSKDFALLTAISCCELGAVLFFLQAIANMLVSYVVAIKRVNILISTLVGCIVFHESVGPRLPYIAVMLAGMLVIVLQPGHENLDHNHRT